MNIFTKVNLLAGFRKSYMIRSQGRIDDHQLISIQSGNVSWVTSETVKWKWNSKIKSRDSTR